MGIRAWCRGHCFIQSVDEGDLRSRSRVVDGWLDLWMFDVCGWTWRCWSRGRRAAQHFYMMEWNGHVFVTSVLMPCWHCACTSQWRAWQTLLHRLESLSTKKHLRCSLLNRIRCEEAAATEYAGLSKEISFGTMIGFRRFVTGQLG